MRCNRRAPDEWVMGTRANVLYPAWEAQYGVTRRRRQLESCERSARIRIPSPCVDASRAKRARCAFALSCVRGMVTRCLLSTAQQQEGRLWSRGFEGFLERGFEARRVGGDGMYSRKARDWVTNLVWPDRRRLSMGKRGWRAGSDRVAMACGWRDVMQSRRGWTGGCVNGCHWYACLRIHGG